MAGPTGETITEGLDGLCDRLSENFQMGARFAKWRAVTVVGIGLPSRSGLETNVTAAPQALHHCARCSRAARRDEYLTAMKVAQP